MLHLDVVIVYHYQFTSILVDIKLILTTAFENKHVSTYVAILRVLFYPLYILGCVNFLTMLSFVVFKIIYGRQPVGSSEIRLHMVKKKKIAASTNRCFIFIKAGTSCTCFTFRTSIRHLLSTCNTYFIIVPTQQIFLVVFRKYKDI